VINISFTTAGKGYKNKLLFMGKTRSFGDLSDCGVVERRKFIKKTWKFY
jgi:hypothetical protein